MGIERSTGDLLFFVDADDTVTESFFDVLEETIEVPGADFAISSLDIAPLRRDYGLEGGDAVVKAMLPAFFGYSFDDVRRWYTGAPLDASREFGSVCRCVFRRSFIEKYALRFDENLRLYEDAPFLAAAALCARKTSSTREVVYRYEPAASGLMRSSLASGRYLEYKFAALENRLSIAAAHPERDVMEHFRASAVFSLVELFRARGDWRGYLSRPFVRESLVQFPLSVRHPLLAAAVLALRQFVKYM